MIDKKEIEEIKNSVDIVNIISQFVKLEKKGNNYMACCPFGHSDSNPSFSVSKDLQIYKCFSCGKAGDVFTFFMDYERLNYPDAVRKVAELSNYKLSNDNYHKIEKKDSILYDIYNDAQKIYFNNLKTKFGIEAKKYLANRNINDTLIDIFGIGYSLKERDTLTKLFLNKKYKEKDLIDSGLINKSPNGIYDSYCNRIMFPIHNIEGKIVGYSGRIYDSVNTSYKYINTKQTDIFKKGELIYNYHRALPFCRTSHKVIIMEGFMDVINSYYNGICNVIAMMGTAVTKYQANNIKRLADEVILCFDGDNAGAHATYTCTNMLLENGVIPKIVRLEENLDPDEYINKYGLDKFKYKLDNPINVMDFKLSYHKINKDLNSIDDRKNYIDEVLTELKLIDDEMLIDLSIDKLSEETNANKQLLKMQLSKIKGEKVNSESVEIKEDNKVVKEKLKRFEVAQRNLVYYMLKSSDIIKMYNKKVSYMPTKKYRILARQISEHYKQTREINLNEIKNNTDFYSLETIYEIESLKLNDKYTIDEINDYIKVIMEYNISYEISKLQEELRRTSDLEEKVSLGEQIRKIKMKGEDYD